MKKKLLIILIMILLIGGFYAVRYVFAKIDSFAEQDLGFKTSPDLVRIIEKKGSLSEVYSAYSVLRKRNNPIAVSVALKDMHSDDAYLWLNASEYLGVLGRKESIPYLIKALRHTAWRADEEHVTSLEKMTGQTFGTNFSEWKSWWTSLHPDTTFDWDTSLGFRPRIESNLK